MEKLDLKQTSTTETQQEQLKWWLIE